MSRRTKLCITALFLVLLLVPAVYVALTWTVENPFRFRYLGQGEPEMVRWDQGPFGSIEELGVPIQLEVENTSSVPINLNAMLFSKGTGLVCGFSVRLPAHSVIRTQAHATPEMARSLVGKEHYMRGEWITAPRERVLDNLVHVSRWLDFLFEYEMPLPTWQRDDYPVEDASASSSSSSRAP